jgi:hypothetical protein
MNGGEAITTKPNVSRSLVAPNVQKEKQMVVLQGACMVPARDAFFFGCMQQRVWAVFSFLCKKFRDTVTLLFICGNYCPTMN